MFNNRIGINFRQRSIQIRGASALCVTLFVDICKTDLRFFGDQRSTFTSAAVVVQQKERLIERLTRLQSRLVSPAGRRSPTSGYIEG